MCLVLHDDKQELWVIAIIKNYFLNTKVIVTKATPTNYAFFGGRFGAVSPYIKPRMDL